MEQIIERLHDYWKKATLSKDDVEVYLEEVAEARAFWRTSVQGESEE